MAAFDVMPFSTSAYLADTGHLTLPQHGAYFLILLAMWRAGGWIEDNDKKLATICKISLVSRWRSMCGPVRELLICKDGKLTQKRLIRELSELKQNPKHESTLTAANVLKTLNTIDLDQPSLLESLEVSKESKKAEAKRKPVTKRKHRLPEDWNPGPTGFGYARESGFDQRTSEIMFEAFRRHHLGRGTIWERWDLAWQTWVRNEVKFNPPRGLRGPQSGRRSFADIALNGTNYAK